MWPFGKNTADRVRDALNAQNHLKDLGLQVQERGGNVTLTGMVPSQAHANLAQSVASGISGVKNVDVSGLVVQPQASAPQTTAAQTTATQTSGNAQPAAQTSSSSAPVQLPDIVQQSAGAAELDMSVFEDQSRIAKAVLSAIRSNGELKDDPIDVLQSGKSVILRGVVDSDHEQRLAEKLAREVDGVAGVDISGLRVAAGAKELTKEKDEGSGDTVYTVKAGDSLSKIAQQYYGDAMEYKKIAHYNNISNPDLIQPGQKLRIPG
ncbi:hypothetical protein DEIPH_ctg044orf0052 [Deinococcus phoenicis]|uniref:Peptidoglycan-binding LysM n=1 Tax=Deinococcus phoenicis TaxID=1476583 RepID=A0A016QMV4_9DEIO|nr:BON domain-containing protein [Deinococcus phoenicis]EYB67331.1 hypothetical protein DEIPH_ctg044orf0052 [Deinococcus phoenicis]